MKKYFVPITGFHASAAKKQNSIFSNMDCHRIISKYDSPKDDFPIQLAFNSALSDDRED